MTWVVEQEEEEEKKEEEEEVQVEGMKIWKGV
jgi:hypothetical protein